ncbi:unnamed protein product, partial [Polarella glacialis]
AGGIKVFMDATADTNMADFAKVMATVKTLELGQLVGGGTDPATHFQKLLSRVRGAGGLESFLTQTE